MWILLIYTKQTKQTVNKLIRWWQSYFINKVANFSFFDGHELTKKAHNPRNQWNGKPYYMVIQINYKKKIETTYQDIINT